MLQQFTSEDILETATIPREAGARSAGFQTCCVADFQVGTRRNLAGKRFGNPRYPDRSGRKRSRLGGLRYGGGFKMRHASFPDTIASPLASRYNVTMASPAITPYTRPKLSARARVQTDKLTGKPVLLYPEGALMLNPTAHAIVSLCSGDKTVEAIVAALAGKYQGSTEQIAEQVGLFLDRLRAKNLLDLSHHGEDPR